MNYAIFRKPSRYIGNEINIIQKEGDVHPVRKNRKGFCSEGIKIALCFPDTYEIGMSHLGLKILYAIINNSPHASAERVYAPWVDFEAYLRQNRLHLTSLENQRPLKDFDIVGFTLQYELSYTNILNMLDLGGIPVRSEERGDEDPLIIAGGPCAVNPLPLIPFIDAFVIGDGEEVIQEIIENIAEFRDQGSGIRDKAGFLNSLSTLEGIYIPSIHDPKRQTIKRRIVGNLDQAHFPDTPLVPYASIVHDRVAIEIARGCTRGCRFCQAGMTCRPLRERSRENILSLAYKSIQNTGYEEISFTSLSTGDYSNLFPLVRDFNSMCSGSHISVSLPSLRVGSVNSDVLKEIKSIRKTGFTIAPEAGTKRLRDVINKDFTDQEYEETLTKLFSEGWKNIKLYFMIGLPTETMADIDGLIDMAVRAIKKGRELTGKRVNINVGISAFVPKPHTPFQWVGQNSVDELRMKQDYIRRAFRKRGIHFKGQHVEHSLLEAVFSRADRNSALLLETAWKQGCRFDSWSELFNFDSWKSAAEKTGINLYEYASRTFDPQGAVPWDFIDTGIRQRFLTLEYEKALKGKISSDCKNTCLACGLECNDGTENSDHRSQVYTPKAYKTETTGSETGNRGSDRITVPGKMRIKFSKTGIMRFLSHHELTTALLRAIKRANIPVSYSSGFHPHPRIAFSPALAAGAEGLNEFFDMEMSSQVTSSDIIQRFNSVLPKGLAVISADAIPMNEPSLNETISCYAYEIIVDNSLKDKINSFMCQQICHVTRENTTVDIRPMVEKADIRGNKLYLVLVDTENANVRLYEILKKMFQNNYEDIRATSIKRVGLYGYNTVRQNCL